MTLNNDISEFRLAKIFDRVLQDKKEGDDAQVYKIVEQFINV